MTSLYREEVPTEHDWFELTRRNARSVQTTIGWIFWDPRAVAGYEKLGLPGPLGYIAARSAPFARAGYSALVAALGSISPLGVRFVVDFVSPDAYLDFWNVRNEAVVAGLNEFAPDIVPALCSFHDELWAVAHSLPYVGRPFSASHLDMPRYEDPTLSAWHAINILREWRGDVHWGIVAECELSGPMASALHNEWLNYDDDWLSKSRGIDSEAIETAWNDLEARGLSRNRILTSQGLELRQWIEDETDRRSSRAWRLLGWERSREFHQLFEPPCELLLERVNITAGVRYQPASRIRPPRV